VDEVNLQQQMMVENGQAKGKYPSNAGILIEQTPVGLMRCRCNLIVSL
jgi:hypothetical protein